MSTGSKPDKAGGGPKRVEDNDLTVALPDRARAGEQLSTEPPTMQRGPLLLDDAVTGAVDVDPDPDVLAVEPTHVAAQPRHITSLPNLTPPKEGDDPYIGRVMSERYRILSKLGEGGMGTVYLAEHVLIEKKVALKVLSDDLARKGDLVTRFMQEAKAASRIGHENIVDITDFGQTDQGSVFFAMEHLDGSDLATAIRAQGPMPFARVRPIVTQICRALGAAHGKGIIHRDMKPENVFLVERDGRADFVKILDFGIAKMSSMDEAGERLTRTGMIFGTPEYMSPEQARGERPDHRVDIYAVGCILYEMLTGDVPFHAETFMGVLTKHMFEPPEPPSRRAPGARITPDVEAVVMRALTKNRDERYASMRDFALAIAACDGGDTSTAWGQEGSGQYRQAGRLDPSGVVARAATNVSPSGPYDLPRRSRAGLWIGILAGGAIAGAVLAWVRTPTTPTVTSPPPPAPVVKMLPVEPPPKPTPPRPDPPPKLVEYKIHVESTPAGAEVFRGAERLGTTPGNFKIEHATSSVTLTVSKKGYKDASLTFFPTKDRNFEPKLEPLPHPTPQRPPARPRADPPKPVAQKADPPKADPPKPDPPKPEVPKKRQARDLMDPFPTTNN